MDTFLPVGGGFSAEEVSGIERVYFKGDEKHMYEENATIDVRPGVNRDLDINGALVGGGEADLLIL